nr:hypothetical protein [Chitinophagaceae bacterium]
MRHLLLIFAFIGFQVTGLNAQGLSKVEKKIVDHVQTNNQSAIELLKESANINSGSLNIEGVKKVGAVYARELEKAGFT